MMAARFAHCRPDLKKHGTISRVLAVWWQAAAGYWLLIPGFLPEARSEKPAANNAEPSNS
jgi:hypothetical protein